MNHSQRMQHGSAHRRAMGHACLTTLSLSLGLALAVLLTAEGASADEPLKVTEPPVMSEPAEITQVVDAFDGEDPFDLNLSLGFQRTWKSSKVRRETAIYTPGLTTGGYVSDRLNVAKYEETTNRLNLRADVGFFKDMALIVRLPIVLSNDRELTDLDGSQAQQSTALKGAPGEQVFRLPFKSPTRSGIEYIAVGVDLGIMNQFRDLTKPTWIFGFEGRFDVAEPMHACNPDTSGLNQAGTQVKCAYPQDYNRNGTVETINGRSEGSFSGGRDPGISRGVVGLEVHTYLSKRVKYIEPYGGFNALFEFQRDASDYGISDLKGSLVNHPPLFGSLVVGVAVIPWEIRDKYQRLTLDFRMTGSYKSEGRDYAELFDALGSSDARTLREPNYASYIKNPAFRPGPPISPVNCVQNPTDPACPPGSDEGSVVDPSSQRVFVTGLSDVQQHASIGASAQVTWQAGEYIKFNLGGGLTLIQTHQITFDQACNPDFSNDLDTAGPCRQTVGGPNGAALSPTGIPNPNFRKTINDPGRRFLVDDSKNIDFWVNAVVMF